MCAALLCTQAISCRRHPRSAWFVPDSAAAVASHTQHGRLCNIVSLQQAYYQRHLAVGISQQTHTDGGGQTSEALGEIAAPGSEQACAMQALASTSRSTHAGWPYARRPLHGSRRHPGALQHCAGDKVARILTDSHAVMDGIRNYPQKPSPMQCHEDRDLPRALWRGSLPRGGMTSTARHAHWHC